MKQVIIDENNNVIGFNINQDCKFIEDMANPNNLMYVDNQSINRAYYSLIVSIQAIKMYNKGIKPTPNFKITEYKKYFGFQEKDNNLFLEYLQGLKDLINEK